MDHTNSNINMPKNFKVTPKSPNFSQNEFSDKNLTKIHEINVKKIQNENFG